MGCGVIRTVGSKDGDAIGTSIETGVSQAIVRSWDRVALGEKGIGGYIVELKFSA